MLLIEKKYYSGYIKIIGQKLDELLLTHQFDNPAIDLGYRTDAGAVYSSNIEGNSIDLNSFMNFKLLKQKLSQSKEIIEIDNLILAYQFAQSNSLNEVNFLHCHEIFAETLVSKGNLGKYRQESVGVFSNSGLVYLAVEPQFVAKTMSNLFSDINDLINSDLTKKEVFYYASMIHLIFAHIHPFRDGNGRAGRLLEKWFLTQKLSQKFWKLSSEKYYKEHQREYYTNINLGVNYYELDYSKCIPFLTMLVNAIEEE